MSRLVSDLIDYTRTHLGSSLPICPKHLDLDALCREVIAEQEVAQPECTFHLFVDGVGNGEWDDHRLAQVLSNLLGNAVQYGDLKEAIVLRLSVRENNVSIAVENRGEVIPAHKIGVLFDPLVRLVDRRPEEQRGSLGIGLYIAREIVRAHGDSIEVSSSAESGTVFTVILPSHPPDDA